MTPPIFTPGGTEVEEVILPDGSEASAVIAPDGTVVFEDAIPDSALYYWETPTDGVSDGDTPDNWTDEVDSLDMELTGITYRTDVDGQDAYDGDGTDDFGNVGQLPDFESVFGTSGGWAVELSFTNLTDQDHLFGVETAPQGIWMRNDGTGSGDPGELNLGWRDNNGNFCDAGIRADVTDGGQYHVVWTGDDNVEDGIEGYVNDASETVTHNDLNDNDEVPIPLEHDHYLWARKISDSTTAERHTDFDCYRFAFHDERLDANDVSRQYNRLEWT